MKQSAWKSKFFAFFLLIFLLGGCTYYNTFYNAKRSFGEGEKAQKRASETRRHSAGRNHYEKAIKKASKVLTFHPKSKWADDALFLIGRAYFNMGEWVKARRKFEELQNSFPKSKLVDASHYHISLCHYYSGQEMEAISSLRSLLESERAKKKRKAEASFLMGEIYFHRKECADATTYYEKTLNEFEPDTLSAVTRLRIGECLALQEDYTEAREAFASVERSNPSLDLLFESRFREGECYYALGDHPKGMEIYQELSDDERFSPRLPAIRLRIAEGYYSLDELCLSMEEYYEITKSSPRTEESAKAYFQMGRIYQEVFGDLQLAKEMYESCSKESRGSEIAKEALAQSANISQIERYQQQLSDEETAQTGKALFLLGELYLLHMNEPDSALMQYLTLADQFPESEYAAKSLYAAAWILENVKGEAVEASRMYRRILNDYPQSDYQKPAFEFFGAPPDSSNVRGAEQVYGRAQKFLFEEHQVDSALVLYDLIIEEFPRSLYAGKSAYAKAWTIEYYANPGDSSAAFAYQSVIDDYPESEYAEEARIKLGLSKRTRPTLPAPRETAPPEEEEPDSTMMAEVDTSGPQIPTAPLPPLKKGEFVYPESEILSDIKGAVVLKIRIEFDGSVSDAEVVNSLENPWIDDAAREAALNTTFDPEKIDMMYVGGWFLYTVEVKVPGQDEDPLIDQTQQQGTWED
jgi:TonB family protein